MILPIGHGESTTRRLPWVTFGIMAVCLLALLATDTSNVSPGYEPELQMEEAAQYWRDHAYLTAEPEIRTRVGYDVMPNQRTQYIALMEDRALAAAPLDKDEWARQQAELDRLTDYALGRSVPPEVEQGDNPYRRWGMLPSQIGILTLFTHIFMHAGWLHLLSNLFMFFLAGPPVEDRLGRPTFLAFFLGAGVFAGLFWAALAPDPNIPLVGASGAISGCLGAFLIRFWNTDIRFGYFFLFGLRPIFGTFEAKAWVMLPLWFANELFQAWLADSLGARGGVAYWAHVGGFVFGAATVGLVRMLGIEEKFIHEKIEAKVTLFETNPIVQQALEAREQGDDAGALATLEAAFAETPNDRDVALGLWDAAKALGEPERGAAAMAALVRLCVSDGDRPLAIQHFMELSRTLPKALAEPNALVKLVPDLMADGDRDLAIRALRHAVDPANRGLSVGMAMRAMEIARELDPPSALRAGGLALASPELHEAKRERIQEALDALVEQGVEEAPDVATAEATLEAERNSREIELDDAEIYGPLPGQAAVPPPIPPSLEVEARRPAVPPPLPQEPPPLALDATGEVVADALPVPPPLPIVSQSPETPMSVTDTLGESLGEVEELPPDWLGDLGDGARFADVKVVEGSLASLDDDVVRFRVDGDRKAKIDYGRIEAVAVAAVRGLGQKPILLVDLLLNWTALDADQLQVVRLKSNAFDPRKLAPDQPDALSAIRAIVARLLSESGAVALPSATAAAGQPFEVFDDLVVYTREVLQVG